MEPARLKIPKGAYAVLKSISQVQLENHFFFKNILFFKQSLYTPWGWNLQPRDQEPHGPPTEPAKCPWKSNF